MFPPSCSKCVQNKWHEASRKGYQQTESKVQNSFCPVTPELSSDLWNRSIYNPQTGFEHERAVHAQWNTSVAFNVTIVGEINVSRYYFSGSVEQTFACYHHCSKSILSEWKKKEKDLNARLHEAPQARGYVFSRGLVDQVMTGKVLVGLHKRATNVNQTIL